MRWATARNALNDMGGCYDMLKDAGPVFITGYCYGGTMSWMAAARLDGIAAASCYYGGNIPQMAAMEPKCPMICHFGVAGHAYSAGRRGRQDRGGVSGHSGLCL